ncbi:MAG: M48 family metallopeptidase [Saprospiraceae bacterium]|nr:M48 family metallopeptidase [Saprospiraceae bacterium]
MKQINHPEIGLITFKKNKRSRRITLRVKPNGHVTVSLPMLSSYYEAKRILFKNINWIKKQQKKYSEKSELNKLTYNSSFKVRHKTLTILPTNQLNLALKIKENNIEIEVPVVWDLDQNNSQSKIQDAIIKALRVESKNYLPQHTRSIAKQNGIKINDIRIKKIKSRWGSCSIKKNINLSLYLMLLPDELIDYVIYHELAHIKHQNHSAKFWQHLEDLYPGAKELDKKMKKYHIPFA